MKTLFFTFIFLSLIISIDAQQWRSTLYPVDWTPPDSTNDFYTDAFLQDFSYAGYHQGEDDIPFVEKNIINVTLKPYNADPTGNIDATKAIQYALDQAQKEGGGVVFLPAGTYKISVGDRNEGLRISASNIVLRGAGKDHTFIYNADTVMTRKEIIKIRPTSGTNWDSRPSSYASITKDLNGPTHRIPVNDPMLFKVGDEVILRNYVTTDWAVEHNEPEWATENHFKNLDGIMSYRKIVEIDNNYLILDAPTRYAYKIRDDACVYIPNSKMISEVGLEDFSIGNKEIKTYDEEWREKDANGNVKPGFLLDDGAHKDESTGAYKCFLSTAIQIEKVKDSWVRNVSTYQPEGNIYGTHILSNGIQIYQSRGITIENVYMGNAQYGAGGNAYGYRIESNDCLIKNSISENMRHGFVFVRMYSNGNVLHNVFDINSGRCTGNSNQLLKAGSSGSAFQQWFSPSNLIDQMYVDRSFYSAVHRKGIGNNQNAVTAHSVFWNFAAISSPSGYGIRTSQTRTGYVIGTKGTTPKVNYQLTDLKNYIDQTVSGISPAFRYDSDGSRSTPEDIVEGEALGATLDPQSLYLDQLSKRLTGPTSYIGDFQHINIKVFPNPATDLIHINFDEVLLSWALYDIHGSLIKHDQSISAQAGLKIKVDDLPAGTYFWKGVFKEIIHHQKVIIH